MEFDANIFLCKKIVIENNVNDHFQNLALSTIRNLVVVCEALSGDLVEESHVRFAIFQMSVDPVVIDNRNAVCIQNSKLKCVTRTLIRNLEKCDNEDPYAQVNKEFHKACDCFIYDFSPLKYTRNAVRAIACFVMQICGILINASVDQMTGPVLTLDQVERYCMYQLMEDGPYINSSLVRFVHFVRENHWVRALSSNRVTNKSPRRKPSHRPIRKTSRK